MTTLEQSRNQLVGAREQIGKLEAAVEALTADAPLAAVEKLSTALTIAVARAAELQSRIEKLEADQARATEEASIEDTRGLVALYDAHGGRISHLPRILQSKIREAVRARGEQRLASKTGLPWAR